MQRHPGESGTGDPGAGAFGAVAPRLVPCKVCVGPALLLGLVDFSKSCGDRNGVRLPLSGIPIYYHRCEVCGFLFSGFTDDWPPEAFRWHIYNGDYAAVDPEDAEARPAAQAALVVRLFGRHRGAIRVLDYGLGSDATARRLAAEGFATVAHHGPPMVDWREVAAPAGPFDLVTCFEVFARVPDPRRLVDELVSWLRPDRSGLILFSTLLQPDILSSLGPDWWYLGPRNGHVSLYSRAAMQRLFGAAGMAVLSFSDGLHAALVRPPAFAAHLFEDTGGKDTGGKDTGARPVPRDGAASRLPGGA